MNENISNFLYGVLGGGIVATGIRIAETYFIAPRFTESIEARKKLFMYARPLSYACHELEYRLIHVLKKVHEDQGTRNALSLSPSQATSIAWFTKEGYYITSTAYLISAVFCWIQLYERDVVFLKFGKTSLTTQFFDLIETFKVSISEPTSILWFHYVNGIGEQLMDAERNRPITISEFVYQLHQDDAFRDYYDQLFVFLNQVSQGQHLSNLDNAVKRLREIKSFLADNRITIAMGR